MYSAHPSVAYAQAILRNLNEKTGRSLEAWITLLDREMPGIGEKERRDWLLQQHQLGSTTAWIVAERSTGKGFEGTDETAYLAAAPGYVEAMYRGRENLRPAHDSLVAFARQHLPAVKISPCETIVPLYRKHVFAQIKPATKKRLELGLCLRNFDGPIPPRITATGGLEKGDRITHRFSLAPGELPDAEMLHWLQVAYDLDR